ncbi:MAG: anthranilate phosphoribosyltransferase [Bacteroidia bacterium]|jgi:anthranilate phosphoribosyltransferase
MKEIVHLLLENGSLNGKQAKEVLLGITSNKYNASEIAAFMSVYLMRPITVEELSGFREAMMQQCEKIDLGKNTIDIVGTGGDGKNTFNISTLSCFVTAAAGYKVAKHGNYGVSSVSGSSNLLEAVGYKFTNDASVLSDQLETAGLCFLHAPLFHPSMKNVAASRKELGVRTFFNMLGPIVNPSSPEFQLLGVYNLETARLYNYLLQETGTRYVIVHSVDGYDEISLTSDFKMITRSSERLIEPASLGFEKLKQIDLSGGASLQKAVEIFMAVLEGNATKAQSDAVCINAAVAISCVSPEKRIEDCIAEAREALESKKALKIFKQLTKN